ncbi:xanthan lyase [Coraliomargarita sinensis]|uniref:Xanthan lyase n=1 Tax=Coraliomargarita sinensis TaxID=2174842 RepID=A0A317ZFI4_9BACT|nr:FAD-dependent oxidoreductase [Coraliomargarita sinensis]PXA04334.1 xanthan lyase [Coraliomargarita sinensis]
MRYILSLFVLFVCSGCNSEESSQPETLEADVVVYGDAAVGVSAAVQAARMGKSVILVSQYGHLGGMTSSGLGWTDIGNSRILGGISREFYHRVYLHYQNDEAWVHQSKDDFPKKGQGAPTFNDATELGSVFEPKVAEMIFDQLVEEAGVTVVEGRLDLDNGTTMEGQRITELHLQDGRKVAGQMFIDASYEGDLLAAADVTFTVGRESNATYDETVNGITLPVNKNNITKPVDPYVVEGDPESGLLPDVNPFDEADVGKGDHRMQAYCYRVCLTSAEDNMVPIAKPENYDEATYELLFRAVDAGYRGQWGAFYKFSPIPNKKTDSNNNGGISMNKIGNNYSHLPPEHPDYWDWTTLSHEEREKVAAIQRDWQLGLIWTLQNHPRMPEGVRKQYSGWGLPKDEFVDNDHWPYNIYVREGRRMISDFVMTENQILQKEDFPQVEDSVGMGAYTMDSHHVQRVVYKGNVRNEGDVQKHFNGKPYPISYKSIVPAEGECENLLVPWCVSSSHIAFGSIRMEPVGMVLGQSAGTAAVLAIDGNVSVQNVDYGKLKAQLIEDGQELY